MKILETKSLIMPDVKVMKFARFMDDRGYFTEPFRKTEIDGSFLPDFNILQVNESYSKKGVLRGMHFQWNPYMGKLVRVVKGHMVDLFLDIRKGSPSYGKIAGFDMPSNFDEDFSTWIWVPVGFAHGCIFFEETVIEYMCTGQYSPGNEAGITPLDPELDWSLCDPAVKKLIDDQMNEGLIISEKDKKGLTLKQWKEDQRSENFIFGKV